jgi:hypothetical protein
MMRVLGAPLKRWNLLIVTPPVRAASALDFGPDLREHSRFSERRWGRGV